ncbi:MAG: hypothetical protein ACLTJ9_07000 [Eggerthella lenta]
MSHGALGLAALALDVLELAAHGRQLLFGATRLGASRIGLAAQLGQLLRQAQALALRCAQGLLGCRRTLLRARPLALRGAQLRAQLLQAASAREHAFLVVNRRGAQGHLAVRPHDASAARHETHAFRPARMRGERRVDVVAYRHVSQQRFRRRGVLVRVRQLVDERAPRPAAAASRAGHAAPSPRAARAPPRPARRAPPAPPPRRSPARSSTNSADTSAPSSRSTSASKPAEARTTCAWEQVHVQVDGMIHKPSARRARGRARALDLFEPLDLGCQKRCRVARLVQRAARRLARAQRLAHAGARGALGLDERLERLPGLRRGLRERHGLRLRALQLQLQLLP